MPTVKAPVRRILHAHLFVDCEAGWTRCNQKNDQGEIVSVEVRRNPGHYLVTYSDGTSDVLSPDEFAAAS